MAKMLTISRNQRFVYFEFIQGWDNFDLGVQYCRTPLSSIKNKEEKKRGGGGGGKEEPNQNCVFDHSPGWSLGNEFNVSVWTTAFALGTAIENFHRFLAPEKKHRNRNHHSKT